MKSDEEELAKRNDEYAENVRRIYLLTIEALIIEALKALRSGNFIDPDKPFRFRNCYPKIKDQANSIFRKFYSLVYGELSKAISNEWSTANNNLDSFVQNILGKNTIEVKVFAKYFNHNEEAMKAFFARKSRSGGLNLSQKVWRYTGQVRQELEAAIQIGIAEGKSSQTLAKQIMKYLQDPDLLAKKVNQLQLEFPRIKGRGIYQSAFKNAMRLTRTETNMAYHTANFERWQQLDFVVGFEVRTSNNHPVADICDDLAGRYPKEFKFVGWHPICRCFTVSILCTREELGDLQDKLLSGEKTTGFISVNQVKNVPDSFTEWVEKNKERATGWASLPYFLRDNINYAPALKALL